MRIFMFFSSFGKDRCVPYNMCGIRTVFILLWIAYQPHNPKPHAQLP